MTEPTPTESTTSSEDVVDIAASGVAEDQTADDQDTEADNANSEAAKYRRRLRDTETQLTTTTDRLTAYQRRHAERTVADVLATPADLFDVGQAALADFLDDEGQVRSDELIGAATALVEQRPQLGKNYQPPWPAHQDFGNGVRSQSVPTEATWAKALAPERRRQ